jgi:hypothetical protein
MAQFNDLKSQLDLVTRNAAGYRAEATLKNNDNLELKVQLDKKIHMLCNKEEELRDVKGKNEELSILHNVLNEKHDQLTALRGTLSTRHSRSLERDYAYEPHRDLSNDRYIGRNGYLPLPPRYESYTPNHPLRSFTRQPYETPYNPAYGNYRNEPISGDLYHGTIPDYSKTDNYYEGRQPGSIAKLPKYIPTSSHKPTESQYKVRDRLSTKKEGERDPITVDNPSNRSSPVIKVYERK